MRKYLQGLVRPSPLITDPEELVRVKALLFFTLAFIMNLGVGIIKTPAFVRPALLVAFPVVVLSYFLARTTRYRIAGFMSISATFIICFLLIYILDTESYYRHTALIWITVTVFMGSIWMSFRGVIYLTIFQVIFSIFVAVFGKNMELSIFASWMPLNIFFCIINLSTRWVLEQYHFVVRENANALEKAVNERTLQLQTNVIEREALIKELYHRTKNNMQVIASLLVIQASFLNDEKSKSVLQEMRTRILSMALVHEKLYKTKNLHAINISEYITSLISEIRSIYVLNEERLSIRLDVEERKLPLEKAVPIGLVLHELIVNAFKYAPTEDTDVVISVNSQDLDSSRYRIEVKDSGQGFPEDFNPNAGTTLGTLLVKNIIENQLDGIISFENSNGAKVVFDIPM